MGQENSSRGEGARQELAVQRKLQVLRGRSRLRRRRRSQVRVARGHVGERSEAQAFGSLGAGEFRKCVAGNEYGGYDARAGHDAAGGGGLFGGGEGGDQGEEGALLCADYCCLRAEAGERGVDVREGVCGEFS